MPRMNVSIIMSSCLLAVQGQTLVPEFPQTIGAVKCIAEDLPHGRVFIGGLIDSIGGLARTRIGAIDITTHQVLDWNPVINGDVEDIAVLGNTVYIGGSFTTVNGVPRSRLAAFDIPSGTLMDWSPSPNSTVRAIEVHDSTVYVAGDFVIVDLQQRYRTAAIHAVTGQLTSYVADADDPVYSMQVVDSTVYFAGLFRQVNGVHRAQAAAVDRRTGALRPFYPLTNHFVDEIYVSDGIAYLGGSFWQIDSQTRRNIGAVDAITGALLPWDPPGWTTNSVLALARYGNTVFAGGNFDSIGDQPRSRLAGLDAGTGAATSWDPSASSFVQVITIGASGLLYAGGYFYTMGNSPRRGLAVFRLEEPVDTDGDGITDDLDDCPTMWGGIGSPCDDGSAGTFNDHLDATCTCRGTSAITRLTVAADPVISCGATGLVFGNAVIYAEEVPGADRYQFNFTNSPGEPAYSRSIVSAGRSLALGPWSTLPMKPNRTYRTQVRVSTDGGATYHPFGPICTIKTTYPPSSRPDGRGEEAEPGNVRVMTGPERLTLDLTGMGSQRGPLSVVIADATGRIVFAASMPSGENDTTVDIPFQPTPGWYMLSLTRGTTRTGTRFAVF